VLDGILGHEAEADPEGEGDNEADYCEPAGAVAVGDGACERGEEGWDDDGEED